MIQISPTARPFIAREYKSFIKHLADSGVFEKQLDAWAYAAAYAMKNKLPPQTEAGEGEMAQLQFLDGETLNCLVLAVITLHPELADESAVVTALSQYASSGAAAISGEIGEFSRNDAYEFLLKQS